MADPSPPEIADYELIKIIGSGSFGNVWLARSVTGLWRAIKHIQPDAAGTTRLIERELAGITRFQQNIPGEPRQLALLHVGRMPDGGFYYVMELADDASGSTEVHPDTYVPLTLKEMQLRRPHLPAREVLRLSIEMARALDGLHRRQLVHRDIKPSNIIFVQGVPKLADVGLVSSSDTFMTSVGTRDFLPPEGAGLPSGDIYSFGKVLYELVMELPAREFPRLPASIRQRADWPLLRRLNQVIRQAAETDPTQRPSNASVLLENLESIPADGELQALRDRLAQLARRSTVALAVAGCLIALLASWVAWTSRELARQERNRRIQAEEEEQVSRYSADLRGVVNALALGDHGAAQNGLERQKTAPETLRGFEWYLLQQEFRDESSVQFQIQPGYPVQLCTAADGSWAAKSSSNRLVWSRPGAPLRTFEAPVANLARLRPDGRELLVQKEDTGSWTTVSVDGQFLDCPFMDSREPLMSSGNWGLSMPLKTVLTAQIWNLTNQTLHLELPLDPFWTPLQKFSSDLDAQAQTMTACFTERIGVESRYWIGVWDLNTRQERHRLEFDTPTYYPTLSPDGKLLAVTERMAGIALYNAHTGSAERRFNGHLNRIDSLSFSPDSRWLATAGGDRAIRLWDIQGTNHAIVLKGCTRPVETLVWTPDSQSLWAGSKDGLLRRFDLAKVLALPPSLQQVYGDESYGDVIISPDGQWTAYTLTNRMVQVAKLPTLTPLGACSRIFQALAFTSEGEVIGFATNWSVCLQRPGEATHRELAPPVMTTPTNMVQSIVFDERQRQLFLGDSYGMVKSVALVPNGPMWERKHHEAQVTGLTLSHDGTTLVSGGSDRVIRFIDRKTGAVQTALKGESEVKRIAFSPDDQEMIVARDDGLVEVWTLSPLRRRLTLSGHNRYAYGLAFVDRGRRLITAGSDGILIFWRRPDYRRIAEIPYFSPGIGADQSVFELKASAEGDTLALLTQDGRLRWWFR